MNPQLKTTHNLYETDFALWIEQTVQLLRDVATGDLPIRARSFEQVDWENVIEEIESLGRSDRWALRSQLVRVIKHLLKLDYQQRIYPLTSWRSSIAEGRTQIKLILEDSPSLKPYLAEVLAECYQDAVKEAGAETELPTKTFPVECAYTIDEVLTREP